MAKFIIEGQHQLRGDIAVSGMKNAATPILAATLLTKEPCVVSNVPRIADVFKMIEILQSMGAVIQWQDNHTVRVQCASVDPARLNQKAVKQLRSSVLLLGPLVARFHDVTIAQPGGCIIGNRPLDTHFEALTGLGALVEEEGETLRVTGSHLQAAHIVLSEFSVTATENLLLAASLTEGTTILETAAMEPHVQDLGAFLKKLGADIEGLGTHTLTIRGRKTLHGAEHRIIPDQIEVGTFAVAAAVTHGEVTIHGVIPSHLGLILRKLTAAGVDARCTEDALHVRPTQRLTAFRLQTLPYPGFPTDLQAPFGVLATQAQGTSLIHDPLFEGRMGYVQELVKMGANAVVCDPHRVLISGPTPLYAQEIRSFDLRAGATLIIAGLCAKGVTTINESEVVDRGYEKIDKRLAELGAVISRA